MNSNIDPRVRDMVLYAWVGEDELGSGEFGLKQGQVPAGCIPLVACNPRRLDQPYIIEQMRQQAQKHGKTIRLARFVFEGLVIELPGRSEVGPPVGTILPIAGIPRLPPNVFKSEGLELSRMEYAELYAVIGETYGKGDGVSTFNIPDFREKGEPSNWGIVVKPN